MTHEILNKYRTELSPIKNSVDSNEDISNFYYTLIHNISDLNKIIDEFKESNPMYYLFTELTYSYYRVLDSLPLLPQQ